MNWKEHYFNGTIIAVILAVVLYWRGIVPFYLAPIFLFGALIGAHFPDLDKHIGVHRKTLHNLFIPLFLLLSILIVYQVTGETSLMALGLGFLVTFSTHILLDLTTERTVYLFYFGGFSLHMTSTGEGLGNFVWRWVLTAIITLIEVGIILFFGVGVA